MAMENEVKPDVNQQHEQRFNSTATSELPAQPEPTPTTEIVRVDPSEAHLVHELKAAGVKDNQLEWILAVRNLAAGSYKDMLCAVHGGLFKVFADMHDERCQAGRALKNALTRLNTRPPASPRARKALLDEVELLGRVVGSTDECMARVNQLIQNSVFTLAMHMAKKSAKLGYTAYESQEES